MHFPQLGHFIMSLSPVRISLLHQHVEITEVPVNMQNLSTMYLQPASSIPQQAWADGTQGLEGLLCATEVRPLQPRLVQQHPYHKHCQTYNTSNSL